MKVRIQKVEISGTQTLEMARLQWSEKSMNGDLGKDGGQVMPALVYNDGLCLKGTRNSLKDCWHVLCGCPYVCRYTCMCVHIEVRS